MTPRRGRGPHQSAIEIAAVGDGYAVTLGGVPARTPGKRRVVVPTAALAREIAREIEQLLALNPAALSGKGIKDPALAPNFRIAAAAIDGIVDLPSARGGVVAELAAYGETDLVCFRADRPEGLVAAEVDAWGPLVDWFTQEFGVALIVTTGIRAVPQNSAALAAITGAIEEHDDFALAALSLATRSAGSIVIGLALSRGRLDGQGAFRASAVEETYQAEHWGADEDAERVLDARSLDLAQAARFLELLAKG